MAKKVKTKRKPRTVEAPKHDLLYPIDITQLGGENDPCFGRLNDPKAEECQRCGDCELCQIVMAQNMHTKRLKVEAKGKYRDLEEKDIYDKKESQTKLIKKSIRTLIRKNKAISLEDVIKMVADTRNTEKAMVKTLITKMLKITDKFKLKNNKLIWLK